VSFITGFAQQEAGSLTIHAKSVEIHPNTTIINSELIIIPE
jgi:hypothetical protein